MKQIIFALVILLSLDYVTGVAVAFTTKTISSNIGARGIIRKLAILLLIGSSFIAESYLNFPAITYPAVIFYCINEFISITENCNRLGIPIPDIIKNALKQNTK